MRPLHLVAALSLVALPAWAQDSADNPRPERLYLNPSGVILGSTRVVALGGAYVGVAEGTSGLASNVASLAHRDPNNRHEWDVGATFSWLDLPFFDPAGRDLDNNGASDQAVTTRQFLLGLLLQYQRFGLGWNLRTTYLSYCTLDFASLGYGSCPSGEVVGVDAQQHTVGAAMGMGRDDFLLGLALYISTVSFWYHGESRFYGNSGLEVDALFRPQGLNYRVGLSVRPQLVASWHRRGTENAFLAGRRVYDAVVTPAVVSLGGSVRLGKGSERYNRLSAPARREVEERLGGAAAGPALEDTAEPPGDWLIAAQLDLVSATENTVPMASFTDLRLANIDPVPVGRTLYLVPRAGVEHETWRGRLRARLGAYVEPSPYPGVRPRPHLTGGPEVFLLEYWQKWAVSASFDVAARYYNVGLSVGFWR